MKSEALYVGVVVGVVALGAGAVGASAYTGRAVTTRLSEQTAALNRMFPQLHAEEEVEHGLFRSSRTIKLQLGCVPVPGPDGRSVEKTSPIAVQWRDTVRHVPFLSARGPGAASIDSELVVEAADVERLFGTRAPLAVHTDIDFDGRFESEAKLVPFKFAPKPGDELSFTGMVVHMKGTFPEAAGTFSYTGNIDPIRISAKAEDGSLSANIGKIELSGSADIDPAAASILLPYRNETRIPELQLHFIRPARNGEPATNLDFALRGVVGTSESKLAGELFSNWYRVQGSLKTGSFAIDKFELASALRNLHAPTFTKLAASVMNRSFSCDQPPSFDQPIAEFDALAAAAAELLPYNPEYEVGPIAIEVAGKRAEVSYTVGVRGMARGVQPPPLLELAMKHGFARAEAKVHLGLLDEMGKWAPSVSGAGQAEPGAKEALPGAGAMVARAMVEGLVEQGFLERDAEVVRGRVEFEAGELKVNGKGFELPDLGGLEGLVGGG